MATAQELALFGTDAGELGALMAALGEKPYRARQLWDALYKQRAASLDEVTTLSQAIRERLAVEGWTIGLPEMVQTAVSVDGTERYLMRMADGETVETVWMPDGDGGERGDGSEAAEEEAGEAETAEDAVAGINAGVLRLHPSEQRTLAGDPAGAQDDGEKQASATATATATASASASATATADSFASLRNDNKADSREGKVDKRNWGALAEKGYRRATICISSQVGCAVNCQFCLTAKLGIRRNLTAGEIAGQVAAVLNRHGVKIGKDRINLVFMGMGEPFLNYDEFIKSVRLLVAGIGIPESRMTVSTSGILPGIERYAQEPVRPKLALSLNASNDGVREQIMPITRKWNIAALLDAVLKVPLRAREWVTFEYVLLGGVNDQPVHAREVLALLAGIRAKVNLIVWNPGPGIDYHQPAPDDVARFQKMLIDGGIATYIRRPRGRDIYAACGQLKRTVAAETQLVAIAAAV